MKYIMMKMRRTEKLVPILFPEEFTHKMVARGAMHDWGGRILGRAVSAGFYRGGVCTGESESLKMESVEGDTEIVKEYYGGIKK